MKPLVFTAIDPFPAYAKLLVSAAIDNAKIVFLFYSYYISPVLVIVNYMFYIVDAYNNTYNKFVNGM